MPSINMIAARRAEKIVLEKRVRGLVLCIMGEIAITLVVLSFMTARIFGASLAIEKLDGELTKIKPTVKQIKVYEARIADLEPKLNLLADSRESTLLWSDILRDLSKSMPSDTWLSNMSTTVSSSPQTDPKKKPMQTVMITLQGTSRDQRLVGETMLRLGQFPEFAAVDLNYTQKSANAQMDTVDFNLAATLSPKETAKGEEAGNAQN